MGAAHHPLSLTLITILTILLLVAGGFYQSRLVLAQQENLSCGSIDGLGVLLGCQKFLEKEGPKVPPSPDCCKAVEDIGMNCTCKLITKEIEGILSMEKLVFVAQACGQPLAPGTQCGSFTVPPATA